MPTLITKRGKKRWKGSVMVNLESVEKLFPDHTKQSQMDAIQWEITTRNEMKSYQTDVTILSTRTEYLNVKTWTIKYLDFVKSRFVKKTYDEKCESFKNQLLIHPDITAETSVQNITIEIAEEILKKRYESGSGYSANKLRKNLSAAWTWGAKYLTDFPMTGNPFWKIDPFPEIEQPRYVPPEDDFWKLFNHVASSTGEIALQDKTILLTFLHCAGRRGEIWRLKISDLDFSNDRIRLWTRKRKNGNYQSDWLPMTKELRSVLLQWVEVRLGMATEDKEHLFVSLEKTTLCDQYLGKPFTNRQHFMQRNCIRAGIPPFGFHAIRHLTASILFKKGYRLGTIQALLRHASKTTTEKYLRSIGIDEVRADLEAALAKPADIIELKDKKKSA